MRLESIKSILLWVLIGASLVLTFALWNYRPDMEEFSQDVEDSTDLGGSEKAMKQLIKPTSVIFRNNNGYYGFADPNDRESLYGKMRKWNLYDFRRTSRNNVPSEDNQVEIIFPDTIPMELAPKMFTFNADVNMPGWGFDRMFITFNRDAKTMGLVFLSEDDQQQARAVVKNSEVFTLLWDRVTKHGDLKAFTRVEGAQKPVYIPEQQVTVTSKTIAVKSIKPSLMVDTLFTDPNIVNSNQVSQNEIYYTDNARGIMRVYPNRRTVEFENPPQSTYEPLEPADLIEQSQMNINDHRGWTDDYNLMNVEINASTNMVRYQMFYGGYPVFGSDDYTYVIEQQFRQTDLHEYNRPLFSLVNYLGGGDPTKLISGSRLIEKIENSSNYNLANIYDITIGYDLNYQSNANAVTLEPAWFMDYNGTWQTVNFKHNATEQGGS